MKLKKILARIGGSLYLILGVVNLLGLLSPEVREEIMSLGAVLFRYSGFLLLGFGLILLRRWSAYLWAALMISNLIIYFIVYGGQSTNHQGFMAILPWVGPILIILYFYYIWPVLKPIKKQQEQNFS